MDQLFAVFRRRGAGWIDGQPLDGQPDWTPHAAFMNALAADGFVLLGGPLEGTGEVLLIVRAPDADAIAARLAEDPWSRADILPVSEIMRWTLRLGALG